MEQVLERGVGGKEEKNYFEDFKLLQGGLSYLQVGEDIHGGLNIFQEKIKTGSKYSSGKIFYRGNGFLIFNIIQGRSKITTANLE